MMADVWSVRPCLDFHLGHEQSSPDEYLSYRRLEDQALHCTAGACRIPPPSEALFSRTQNPAEEITPYALAAAWAQFDAMVFDDGVNR
jgi:hypothetical protein